MDKYKIVFIVTNPNNSNSVINDHYDMMLRIIEGDL